MPINDVPRTTRLQLAAPRLPSSVRPALTYQQRDHLEFLSVDRSHFAHYPMPRWSTEGELGDQFVRSIHQTTTLSDRIEAWRCLFAGVDGEGRPLIKEGRLWWAKPW